MKGEAGGGVAAQLDRVACGEPSPAFAVAGIIAPRHPRLAVDEDEFGRSSPCRHEVVGCAALIVADENAQRLAARPRNRRAVIDHAVRSEAHVEGRRGRPLRGDLHASARVSRVRLAQRPDGGQARREAERRGDNDAGRVRRGDAVVVRRRDRATDIVAAVSRDQDVCRRDCAGDRHAITQPLVSVGSRSAAPRPLRTREGLADDGAPGQSGKRHVGGRRSRHRAGTEPDDEHDGVGFRGLHEGDRRAAGVIGRAGALLNSVDGDEKLFVLGDVDCAAVGGDGEIGEVGCDLRREQSGSGEQVLTVPLGVSCDTGVRMSKPTTALIVAGLCNVTVEDGTSTTKSLTGASRTPLTRA